MDKQCRRGRLLNSTKRLHINEADNASKKSQRFKTHRFSPRKLSVKPLGLKLSLHHQILDDGCAAYKVFLDNSL